MAAVKQALALKTMSVTAMSRQLTRASEPQKYFARSSRVILIGHRDALPPKCSTFHH
jgi:hypothetical protein